MHREPGLALLVAAAIGIAGAAGAAVAQLNKDIISIVQDPEIRERFLSQGAAPAFGTPEQFLKLQKDEYARVQKLIKDLGIESR